MSRIPPQGARMVGAWPNTVPRQTRPERPARAARASRSAWLTRVLHPLHHPMPEGPLAASPAPPQQPVRHA
jgi:hypothetical protein